MKFKTREGVGTFSAYGYWFTDEGTEVTDETLVAKFKQYHQLEVVGAEPAEKTAPAPKKKAGRPKKATV